LFLIKNHLFLLFFFLKNTVFINGILSKKWNFADSIVEAQLGTGQSQLVFGYAHRWFIVGN